MSNAEPDSSLDNQNESGLAQFHRDCSWGSFWRAKECLENGVDPNCRFGDLDSPPLHVALWNGHVSLAELLLRYGADPRTSDAEGSTPLHVICKRWWDTDHTAERFLEICAAARLWVRIDAPDKKGRTPLQLAAANGLKRAIESLLRRGADPNTTDEQGMTPLHIMSHRVCDADLLRLFFEINAELNQSVRVNARDKLGNTPLHWALEYGCRNSVGFLLRNGADPNIANEEGSTCLHVVCRRSRDRGMPERFVEVIDENRMTVRVDARDKKGDTPMHVALARGHRPLVEFLLRNGADPNLATAAGCTPLHLLCRREDDGLTKVFFELCGEMRKTVRFDARHEGRTPLQWAALAGLPNVVDLLLDNGADLSEFVYSTVDYDEEIIKASTEYRLIQAAGALACVERLEKRGYELDRGEALSVMNQFARYGLFEKSPTTDLERNWYDDEEFASYSKKTTIKPSLSLDDLIRSRPEDAKALLTHLEHYEFVKSTELLAIPDEYYEAVAAHLTEKMWRRFFRTWALYPFWEELIHRRLPLLCCDLIIQELTNQDLHNICVAAITQDTRGQ
ncbi:unnamed protein product [Trichogramma brassicae]|uniref:Uncharacterized protein n=1 Tax=Trichogramma brassicae TaxID=86971 RepID=A0A6H5IM60_9HYME|nr:unnamed protein product [Trichogramma brassicae]